jgi:hypothetical protein
MYENIAEMRNKQDIKVLCFAESSMALNTVELQTLKTICL